VLLSGGIDSTLITSRLATQGYQQFSTFTAAFPGSTLDRSTRQIRPSAWG
jgi:asparagine synthase (glutamine-hydrolysing)